MIDRTATTPNFDFAKFDYFNDFKDTYDYLRRLDPDKYERVMKLLKKGNDVFIKTVFDKTRPKPLTEEELIKLIEKD